ncbi:MAG: 16S rRNA (adenine(1518)-N(6)/adenine(1519)-N(6))-dimethyltransferase RsmA [Pseudomonadota bacterium]
MPDRADLTHAAARKALGQHFLFDPNILNRTALAAGLLDGRHVIEIGPGPGGLTRAILDNGAASLTCVEADARFATALQAWPEAQAGRLYVLKGDARRVDWPSLPSVREANQPVMIISNLPYNVGTPLLVTWLKAGNWRGEMALMFQKEVAQRVCARPGSRQYGRLAVLTAAVCDAAIAFTLPPGAFRPPPKVDSAVVVLKPLPPEHAFPALAALETVVGAAFAQRRKMLRVALKPLAKSHRIDAEEWLKACEIDPTARAETLSQAQFRHLAIHFAGARR